MLVEDMSINKCFYSRFEYPILYVIYSHMIYLVTLPLVYNYITVLITDAVLLRLLSVSVL
jgi:hypothetical protein